MRGDVVLAKLKKKVQEKRSLIFCFVSKAFQVIAKDTNEKRITPF